MFNRIILLSGPISSGKSTLAKGLAERFGMPIFKTSEILKKQVRSNLRQDRKVLQAQGERLDRKTRVLSISEMGHFLNRTLLHNQVALTSSLRPLL
jgi:dephospho-CoA kinase